MTTTQQIHQWLLDRGLTEDVITYSGIFFNGYKIVIPVYDENGDFLFNKYRKDPFIENDEPKYMYDKGSASSLYNVDTIKNLTNEVVFICEGELDTLRMNSLGFNAASTTSGSGTFDRGWNKYFGVNQSYIVYDNDEAGIRGALRVQRCVPTAKIVFWPDWFKGKDVTDFFKTHTVKEFLKILDSAESWNTPYEPAEIPDNKASVKKVLEGYKAYSAYLLEKKREYNSLMRPVRHIEILLETTDNRIEHWKKQLKMFGIKPAQTGDDVAAARSVPIPRYVEFNRAGFAPCLWHEEKSPSMKYYPAKNKVYCFGCSASKDVIDVVQQKNQVDFKQAIKLILGTSS